MAWRVMKTGPSGEVDFSFEFEHTIFCIVPSSVLIAVVVANAISFLRQKAKRQSPSLGSLFALDSALLLILVLLHLASIITFSKLPKVSELQTQLALTAYALRFGASVALFGGRLLMRDGIRLTTGLYLLLTSILDGIIAHSLWVVALDESKHGTERSLAGLQTAVPATALSFVALQSIKLSSLASNPARGAGFKVEEQASSTLSTLFFGWLWYLLAFGKKNKISNEDLQHILYHPAATYKFDKESKQSSESTSSEFFAGLTVCYLSSSFLQLLAAGATLAQPLIVQGIVKYLQSDQHHSVGVWLVVAMLFDNLAIAFLDAHSGQILAQVMHRLRAFLNEKVLERSFSSTAPVGGWTDASSKAVVYLSTDIPTITHGISISNSILSSLVVVGIGSFLLFRLINLAFLGPLLVVLASTLVPVALGKTLARSQRLSLEATERRIEAMKSLVSETRAIRIGGLQKIAADLVTQNRRVEIDTACAYRRVVTIVAVAATSVNGLAVLAAFGGFSLIDRLNIDYSVLFTALATMHIMITPLLTLVQMLPVFISSFVSVNRLMSYINHPSPPNSEEIQCIPDGSLLSFTNTDLGWDAETPIVSGINLNLYSGEVICISGPTNSGKSTIMNAILGEAKLMSGDMQTGWKKIAYCSQKAWFIPGLSIRDTITLGKQFDSGLYDRIVKCCCLDKDLLTLQLGDDATLDNTGAPLSGGQQKRVALARALYHEPDLLLLDEVLVGLDATTQRQVVNNLFGNDGIVKQSGRMGVFMVMTEFPGFLSQYSNTRTCYLNSGQIVVLDSSVSVVTESSDNRGSRDVDTMQDVDVQQPAPAEAPGEKHEITDPATLQEQDVTADDGTKVSSPYRAYFNSFSSLFAVSIVLLALLAGVAIDRASAFWLSKWTSTYERSHSSTNDGYYVGVYASFVAGSAIVSFCGIWVFFMEAIPDSSWVLHNKMLTTLLKTPAFTVEKTKPEIINRFTQDIDAIDMNLPQALQNLVFAIASGLGSIIVIGIGSPYTLVLIVFILPILYILQKHYLATSAQLRKLQVAAQAPIFSTVGAAVEGRVTLRAMQKQSYMADTLSERVYSGLRPGYLFSSVQRWMLLALNLANASVLTVLAALLVGLRGRGNIGWAGLALLNAVTLSQDTMLLMIWWTSFENHMASMERILEYTTATPIEKVKSTETPIDETWPMTGRIHFQHLSLSYGNHEAVRGVDIDIPPGFKVAVIGRTGSGKTSLTQCLFGLIDTSSGCVLVDGVNINTIDTETLRERIVGHPQFTFSNGTATVRKNIDPFDSFSDDAIRQTLSRVAVGSSMCDDVMSKLENKWDECSFSTGWQQRIALARAILRQSNVYVLDEPTSGMDEESHSLVMGALFDALADRTVLVVTHLLLGIERFDLVLVMSDGRLVESGRPSALLLDPSTKLSEFVQATRAAERSKS